MSVHYNPLHQPPGRLGLVPAELTDPALALDAAPRVLTRLQGLKHGHAILSRLAVGDRSALLEAGVITRQRYDTQVHEWAVGYDRQNDDYYLVTGGPNKVDWAGATLQGLEAVAHTHPYHPVDHAAVRAALAPTVVGALGEWLMNMSGYPIAHMPGDLWFIFPSNQDVGSAYYTSHQTTELVYTPFRLAPDGWLSSTEGPTLAVEFGPIRAALKPDAAATVRSLGLDVGAPAGMLATERRCLQFLSTRITFRAGGDAFIGGHLRVDPLTDEHSNSPHSAWFRAQSAEGLMTRADVWHFILSAAGRQ